MSLYFPVPPEIDDLKTSSDVHVNENDEALLECHANGHPKPDIKWLREDKANFTVYDRNNKRMIGKHVRAGIKRDSTVLPYMKCIKSMFRGFKRQGQLRTMAVHIRTVLC